MIKHFSIFLAIFFSLSFFMNCEICSKLEERIKHEYFPLRHCQRSNQTIIGLTNVDKVEDCASFARRRRGLAFNFGPKDRGTINLYDKVDEKEKRKSWKDKNTNKKPTQGILTDSEEYFNCHVLDCPEYGNFSSIINDTRFDYYSLYTRPPPPRNSSCVPSVGMFFVRETQSNYSAASMFCQNHSATLAHIASEARTMGLAKLFAQVRNSTLNIDAAYVGLNESALDEFRTSWNEPLKCFFYRAWHPGHPSERRRPGCVALTTKASWKVFGCTRKMPFICELHTSGPNEMVNIDRECRVNRPNNRIIKTKEENFEGH